MANATSMPVSLALCGDMFPEIHCVRPIAWVGMFFRCRVQNDYVLVEPALRIRESQYHIIARVVGVSEEELRMYLNEVTGRETDKVNERHGDSKDGND